MSPVDRLLLTLGTAAGLFASSAAALWTVPATAQQPAAASPPATDQAQKIAEVQKQIEALTKQLEELKKAQASAPATTAGHPLPPSWTKAITWRSIGPANMSGRIVDLAVYEADPCIWWAATASGGLLKTTNNGITWEHQFDKEPTVSIGAVAVAPSNPEIVYVGTGENNPRNSVSYGDGVYKSTDGGKTWTNVGLTKTFQIGRIVIHPTDPEIVYVGALGRLYGPNEDRGLYKTTDGGKTWNKILYVDDKSGVIDMRMHPTDPETLIVAFYERQRDGFDVNEPAKRWGPGSGLYKTTDGGKTWKKLTKGLPENQSLGRIGLDWYRKDPNVVFAIVEAEKIGMGPPLSRAYLGVQGKEDVERAELAFVTEGGPADKAGLKVNDILLSVDGKPLAKYDDLVSFLRDKKPGDTVTFKIKRGDEEREISVTLGQRPEATSRTGGPGGGTPSTPRAPGQAQTQAAEPEIETPTEGPSPPSRQRGGASAERPFMAQLNGQQENVQDRQGPDGWQYGGLYKSTDGGESWTRINSINPRPMYFSQVRVDPSNDQYVYVLGVAMYRSTDGGKTFRGDAGRNVHADGHALWINPKDGRHAIAGTDGGVYVTCDRFNTWDHLNHAAIGQFYHVALDPRRPSKAYGGLQDNGTWGGPLMTRNATGPINEDWISIGGGDGFKCVVDRDDPDLIYYTSQYGAMGRRNLRTGESASIRPRAPAGQRLVWNWNTPFLLSHHNSKIFYAAGNYVFRSLDRGNDMRLISPKITATDGGSATTLAESPKNPNVLYVGTDDGNLWVTKDSGTTWTDIRKNVGLPGPYWVATLEASRAEEGRVYACFDAHRSDDDKPYVFVSEDFGATWTNLSGGLPMFGSSRCLREDLVNPNILYCGTEFALFASIDRGKTWTKINNNLPTVCIYDLAQHPTSGEIVLATHGRSLWVGEVSPLRQVNADVLAAPATLFKPVSAIRFRTEPSRGRTNRRFVGENPQAGAAIYFALNGTPEKVSLKIVDFEGKTVRDLSAPREAGLHRVVWNLTRTAPANPGQSSGRGPAGGGGVLGAIAGAFAGRTGFGPPAAPGMYRVVLTVDGKEFSQPLRVEADPAYPPPEIAEDEQFEADDVANEVEVDDDDALPTRFPIDDSA